MSGRIDEENATAKLGGLNLTRRQLAEVHRVRIIAAGTSWHAGIAGSYLLEQVARIPAQAELASELRYRNPVVEQGSLWFVVSQSGETADSLAALRLAVYEMEYDADVPTGVAINEAVELAKRFGGDASGSFVNGVLGKIASEKDEKKNEEETADTEEKAAEAPEENA